MPTELTDDQVFGAAAPSKELSDEQVFGKTPAPTTTEPQTVLPKLSGHVVPLALGLLEQPGAGLYSMMTEAVAGSMALYSAVFSSNRTGDSWIDSFTKDYENFKASAPKYTPITPEGAKITEVMSKVLGAGVQAYGDAAYDLGRLPISLGDPGELAIRRSAGKTANSPAAGALGQAAATLATIAAVPGVGKGKIARVPGKVDVVDPIAEFKQRFPLTDQAIEASKVGKIIPGLKAKDPAAPLETATVRVMDAVDQALNDELGLDPVHQALQGNPLSVADKMKMVIAKHGQEKIPVNDQIRIANAYADKFKTLQDYQDAAIASREGAPLKPQPTLITPKQIQELQGHVQALATGKKPRLKLQGGAVDIELLTPGLQALKKSLERVEGIAKDAHGGIVLFRGRSNTPPESAAEPSPHYGGAVFVTDNPYAASTFAFYAPDAAIERPEVKPGKVYPFVLRADVEIKEFPHVDEYGGFSYGAFDKFAASLGPNQVAVARNSVDGGGYDPFPREKTTAKNDQYAFTDPSVVVPLYEFLALQKEGKFAPRIPPKQQYEAAPQVMDSDIMKVTPVQEANLSSDWRGIKDSIYIHKKTGHNLIHDPEEGWYLYNKGGDVVGSATDVHALLDYMDSIGEFNPGSLGIAKGQRGATDIEGLDKNLPALAKAGKEAVARGWTVGNQPASAQKVEQVFERSYDAIKEKRRLFSKETAKSLRRGFVQHDYDLEKALTESGELGQAAVLKMNVEHNATMAAKTRYDAAVRSIFDDLSPKDLKLVEKIIRARRIVQIDAYKGINTVRHEGGVTGPDAAAYLVDLEKKIGSSKFKELDGRATSVFAEERTNLKRLLDTGLIDEETFNKMKNLDYTRTEYLDTVDPEIPITSHIAGLKSIRSSGIPRLGRGKDTAVQMNARLLLTEDIARVENRIARNQTLQAMYKLAEDNPGNDIVEVSKSIDKEGNVRAVPEGWTSLGVRVEGKQKHFIIRDDYAEQFVVARDTALNKVLFRLGDMQFTIGNLIRTVSMSSLMRATATTYNPFFAFAGLPMDILHVWAATSGVYSPHLPIYLAQIGKDLAVTAKDALTHTGRWEVAMQEGLGPNFLTHEARNSIIPENYYKTLAPKLEKTRKILSLVGDTQETWVRLAHRERLINAGIASPDATAMSVARLNYNMGGPATKFIDAAIPYTNVSVIATAQFLKTAAKDPVGTATKVAWFVGAASAAKLATMLMSPETDKSISVDDKVRNFNLTFGDQYFIIDPDGNKRYVYVPIRIDQVWMPFKAAVEGGLEWSEYGKVPDGLYKKAVGQVTPVSTMFPPSLNAIRAYTDNYDPFRDSNIYSGTKVKPEDQIRTYAKGKATSPLFVSIGKATGLSPMGLERASQQVINTNNFWLQLMGGSLKYMFGGMDPREQSESTLQLLQSTGLNRVAKLTTPGTQIMKDMEKAEEEFGSKHKSQIDSLDNLLFQLEQGKGGVSEKTVQNYIASQPLPDREKLTQHARYAYNVDKILKQYKASEGIPPRAWWIRSARIPAEVRAQVFYEKWISADADSRKRMMEVGNAMQRAGTSYFSQEFQRAFAKERQLMGDEAR